MNDPVEEKRKTELLEALAELEHRQWMDWSLTLVDTEDISLERRDRWRQLWKPYSELTEEEKHQDRRYAEDILWVIKKHMGIR